MYPRPVLHVPTEGLMFVKDVRAAATIRLEKVPCRQKSGNKDQHCTREYTDALTNLPHGLHKPLPQPLQRDSDAISDWGCRNSGLGYVRHRDHHSASARQRRDIHDNLSKACGQRTERNNSTAVGSRTASRRPCFLYLNTQTA